MAATALAERTTPIAVDDEQVSNGASSTIEEGIPYRAVVKVTGTAPLLFHAWNIESINEKAVAAKGSRAKKTDNLESYVYRDQDGNLGIPGANFVAALVQAGRFTQDPRSPRKSAMDLVKSGIIPLVDIATFEPHVAKWDYEDARRVVIQRAGVTRIRPAMKAGWACTFELLVTVPEYLPPAKVLDMIGQAGKLIGVCDFRPSYGRFAVVGFEVLGI